MLGMWQSYVTVCDATISKLGTNLCRISKAFPSNALLFTPMEIHNQLHGIALRYFLEVVKSGSLTVASERLHVAPSAISRQISSLEQLLGVELFERQPRGMLATAAGEILAAHARDTILEAERIVDEVIDLKGGRQGMVRIACTEGFASQFLPESIWQFRQQHDKILFDVSVVSPAEVSARLRNGEADIGLAFSRNPEKDIRVEFRHPARILALMKSDHPLSNLSSVTLKRLTQYPIALPAPDSTLRQMIDIECSRQQLHLAPVLTTNAMSLLHSFVLHGGGISVSSEISIGNITDSGAVSTIPMQDFESSMRDVELQCLAGRTLPRPVQSFVDFLKNKMPQPHLRRSRKRTK